MIKKELGMLVAGDIVEYSGKGENKGKTARVAFIDGDILTLYMETEYFAIKYPNKHFLGERAVKYDNIINSNYKHWKFLTHRKIEY